MKRETLKRCPFCGGRAERGIYGSDWMIVHCRRAACGATVGGVTLDEAVALWNKRTPEAKTCE